MPKHYVDRVCDWNAARYEQVLDVNLAQALLQEETEEFMEAVTAKDAIETLDAIGDIAFVSIGVLWKAGVARMTIKKLMYNLQHNLGKYRSAGMNAIVKVNKMDATAGNMLSQLFSTMEDMQGALEFITNYERRDLFPELVGIICDSNETKAVPNQIVDASVKANINKGENFVPPTKALEEFKNKYWRMEDESNKDDAA